MLVFKIVRCGVWRAKLFCYSLRQVFSVSKFVPKHS